MKKILVFVLVLVFATISFAGKEATTPSALNLNSDKVELINADFIWGSIPANNICRVTYQVWNNDRSALIREITFNISGSDFTDLVSGYGSTMETRLESNIWTNIQSEFDIVP